MRLNAYDERDRSRRINQLKCFVFAAFVILMLMYVARAAHNGGSKKHLVQVRLGERLFQDERFSSPKGDLITSCSHCHLYNQDPERVHAFTDSFARSWVPYRSKDPRRDGLRNAPTLFDVGDLTRLHFDGEFRSLEELVKGTLSGRPFGWLPGEEGEAFQQVYLAVMNDTGRDKMNGAYRDQFRAAYGVSPEKLNKDDLINLVARAISDYLRTLRSNRRSPYDRFIQANGLEASPSQMEGPAAFAKRMLARISDLESKRELKTDQGFDADAIEGMKIFFTTKGVRSAGNCISCHMPPLFTDSSFHNMGVTQSEYDQIYGDGSFAALKIPSASEASRPSAIFRETPSRDKPGNADLGHWNFVDVSDSTLRRATESPDQFLQRMIATFKTPTLRNLAHSQPYMHNGAYPTLEGVLRELMRLSDLARAGLVREADDGLAKIRISEADIRPLAAFLNALNENFIRQSRARALTLKR